MLGKQSDYFERNVEHNKIANLLRVNAQWQVQIWETIM